MTARVLSWTGPEGGQIGVGFDDGHFGPEQMTAEIASAGRAYPNLPDEVPVGTRFLFAKDSTGHLIARFKVGSTVYRSGGQRELRGLWVTMGLIDQMLHPEHYKIAS